MTENIARILAEQPGGDNDGRVIEPVRIKDDDVSATRGTPLDGVTADFLRGDGWQTVSNEGGRQLERSGMVAHRGVLHPDEYVDFFALREQVEADLGYSYADVSAAYANGRPTAEQRQLREKIDARLLALSRAGGNMEQLAKALGLNEKTLRRSLLRAREIEVDAIVKNPAVVKPLVCFKTGELGAKLRKRRFSDSPPQWTGSVALCDDEYAKGFDRKPGNPAYWDFRDARTPLRGGPARPAKRAQRFPADYPDDQAYADFLGR